MCDRNEVSQSCAQASHTAPLILLQQLTQKDKVLWKGASQGSVQEQGLSTPSVTLLSEQIGFVLVNEGERKEEKRHMSKRKGEKTELLWLMSGSPSHVRAKKHCFSSSVVMLFFSPHLLVSFPSFLAFPVLFCFASSSLLFFFCFLLKQALNID